MTMKHVVMFALLLVSGVLNVHADSDVYHPTTKHARSDFELHAASAVCAQRFGAPDTGTKTSAQYKRCMLEQGWRFGHTVRERSRDARGSSWIDPETGLRCRRGTFMGVPSSDCSNIYGPD